jgi:hypothetical protein
MKGLNEYSYFFGRVGIVTVAVNGFGAPVAFVRATPGGNKVD